MSTLTQYCRHQMTDEDRAYEADQMNDRDMELDLEAEMRVRDAAPELLSALELSEKILRELHYVGPQREINQAAIAKAKGEA